MKRVTIPCVEPAVLREFRDQNPEATWDEFKNQRGNEQVFDCLAARQGHICAYCEIRISRPLRGQVEHFEPKSTSGSGRNIHLELSNLLACCEGGANSWQGDRSEPPISDTIHCGQLKNAESPHGRMLDPRSIPVAPLIWRTSSQGQLVVDREGCVAAGVDLDIAEQTLILLGLNRRTLVRKRERVLRELYSVHESEAFTADVYLLPDQRGRLTEFWSTVRYFGGPECDSFIVANADRIPGLANPKGT